MPISSRTAKEHTVVGPCRKRAERVAEQLIRPAIGKAQPPARCPKDMRSQTLAICACLGDLTGRVTLRYAF